MKSKKKRRCGNLKIVKYTCECGNSIEIFTYYAVVRCSCGRIMKPEGDKR